MGWNSANEIVDPVIDELVKGVSNDEMDEAVAEQLLFTLIKKCQEGDWDTEDETLEKYVHVPFVVSAFRRADVSVNGGDPPERLDVERAVRRAIDANAEEWHDLSGDFPRNIHVLAITNAVMALFAED